MKWQEFALINVLCAITISAQAQNSVPVQGVVRNEHGVVMEGVSVKAKGKEFVFDAIRSI